MRLGVWSIPAVSAVLLVGALASFRVANAQGQPERQRLMEMAAEAMSKSQLDEARARYAFAVEVEPEDAWESPAAMFLVMSFERGGVLDEVSLADWAARRFGPGLAYTRVGRALEEYHVRLGPDSFAGELERPLRECLVPQPPGAASRGAGPGVGALACAAGASVSAVSWRSADLGRTAEVSPAGRVTAGGWPARESGGSTGVTLNHSATALPSAMSSAPTQPAHVSAGGVAPVLLSRPENSDLMSAADTWSVVATGNARPVGVASMASVGSGGGPPPLIFRPDAFDTMSAARPSSVATWRETGPTTLAALAGTSGVAPIWTALAGEWQALEAPGQSPISAKIKIDGLPCIM